jgi:hypothetical protein
MKDPMIADLVRLLTSITGSINSRSGSLDLVLSALPVSHPFLQVDKTESAKEVFF